MQAIFDIQPKGFTLVVGGDGRCFSSGAIQLIIGIAAVNDVTKRIIGTNGIFSTPAASDVIRKYRADGGILLTASRNPGELNDDLGIKYNISNHGLALENVTNKIFETTKTISEYKVIHDKAVRVPMCNHDYVLADLLFLGRPLKDRRNRLRSEIIDSVVGYVRLLESVFDYDLIKKFLTHTEGFGVLFDGIHNVTGPYAHAIHIDKLDLPGSS